jgi:hypothetical protein
MSPFVQAWGNSEFVSSGTEADLALLSLTFLPILQPLSRQRSSPCRLLILFGCGCFILFLAWLVVDARVSSRHDPSPARFGLTPHMDLIPHLNNQDLLVREFPSCDRQLRQNCHGSLNSTPPRPTSSLSFTLLISHMFELPFAFVSSSPSSLSS